MTLPQPGLKKAEPSDETLVSAGALLADGVAPVPGATCAALLRQAQRLAHEPPTCGVRALRDARGGGVFLARRHWLRSLLHLEQLPRPARALRVAYCLLPAPRPRPRLLLLRHAHPLERPPRLGNDKAATAIPRQTAGPCLLLYSLRGSRRVRRRIRKCPARRPDHQTPRHPAWTPARAAKQEESHPVE